MDEPVITRVSERPDWLGAPSSLVASIAEGSDGVGSSGVEDSAWSALIKDITLDVKHNGPDRVHLVHDPPKACPGGERTETKRKLGFETRFLLPNV
jgi:hypothetical protein